LFWYIQQIPNRLGVEVKRNLNTLISLHPPPSEASFKDKTVTELRFPKRTISWLFLNDGSQTNLVESVHWRPLWG